MAANNPLDLVGSFPSQDEFQKLLGVTKGKIAVQNRQLDRLARLLLQKGQQIVVACTRIELNEKKSLWIAQNSKGGDAVTAYQDLLAKCNARDQEIQDFFSSKITRYAVETTHSNTKNKETLLLAWVSEFWGLLQRRAQDSGPAAAHALARKMIISWQAAKKEGKPCPEPEWLSKTDTKPNQACLGAWKLTARTYLDWEHCRVDKSLWNMEPFMVAADQEMHAEMKLLSEIFQKGFELGYIGASLKVCAYCYAMIFGFCKLKQKATSPEGFNFSPYIANFHAILPKKAAWHFFEWQPKQKSELYDKRLKPSLHSSEQFSTPTHESEDDFVSYIHLLDPVQAPDPPSADEQNHEDDCVQEDVQEENSASDED